MEYKVYTIGTNNDLSSMFCIDKKNNNLMRSVYQAFEKNLFVEIHVVSDDGSKTTENAVQVNPRYIEFIWELDRSVCPVHLGGDR